ncbi:MAG: anti-sigma-factor antagonist [Naasia sp.]|nr:anti-sigma-factor antagonist [Naasia sp.]
MDFPVSHLPDGVAVLRPAGKLNMVSSGALREAITGLLEAGHRRLVADLSEVTFMDSSGLGALIGGLKSARQAGGDLRIAAVGEQIRMVLQLTNMERVLPPFERPEAAYADV